MIMSDHVWPNNLSKPLRCILKKPLTSTLQSLEISSIATMTLRQNWHCFALIYILWSPVTHLLNPLNYGFLCFVTNTISYSYFYGGGCFPEWHKPEALATRQSRVNSLIPFEVKHAYDHRVSILNRNVNVSDKEIIINHFFFLKVKNFISRISRLQYVF